MHEKEGQQDREREPEADPTLSMKPDTGLNPTTRDHHPSRHQVSAAQLTEPPRRLIKDILK